MATEVMVNICYCIGFFANLLNRYILLTLQSHLHVRNLMVKQTHLVALHETCLYVCLNGLNGNPRTNHFVPSIYW